MDNLLSTILYVVVVWIVLIVAGVKKNRKNTGKTPSPGKMASSREVPADKKNLSHLRKQESRPPQKQAASFSMKTGPSEEEIPEGTCDHQHSNEWTEEHPSEPILQEPSAQEQEEFHLSFNRNSLLEGIILSEVLGRKHGGIAAEREHRYGGTHARS